MVYIIAERKYFLMNRDGKLNEEEFDTYDEAEAVLAELVGDVHKPNTKGIEITSYDRPLYHEDFIIQRKSK